MTAYSTQGSIIEIAKQAEFGTAQTTGFVDIRAEGTPTVKTPVGMGVRPDTLFANEQEQEKPIVIKEATTDGMKIGTLIRRSTAAGGVSYLETMFAAAGCDINEPGIDTLAAGTPTATLIDVTVDDGDSFDPGYGVVIKVTGDGGKYIPALVNSVSTDTLKLQMALPAAPSLGDEIINAITVFPGSAAQIPATSLCTLRANVKAHDGTNDELIIGQDGVVTGLADLSLEPNSKVIIEATWGFSDMSQGNQTLPDNGFIDAEGGVKILHEPYAQFATAASAGAITAAYHKIIRATFTWGVSVEQIAGFGDTACKNNIQGYISKYEPAKLTLTMLYDSNKLDDFEGTNTSRYVSIIQPGSSASDAAWGLFLPNAHIMEAPEADYYGNNEHRVTVSFTPRPAGLAGAASAGDADNQPWYFVLQNQAS